ILGWTIPSVESLKNGASAVILADREENQPKFQGLEAAAKVGGTDFRIFGKPFARPYRRMGVALSSGPESVQYHVENAKKVASLITIT
ncbi:MAG: phosphoribosylglycinamide formyltransferase 2, partial [Bacteroidota bacterium]